MTIKSWSLPVDENGAVNLPEELMKLTGWTPETRLEWDVSDSGKITLRKIEPSQCKSEPDAKS